MESLNQYESSDEESQTEIIQENRLKRKASIDSNNVNKMPKLPSFFNIQTQNSTTMESHNGRVRTIPHKVDSWATYVYFKVNLSNSEIIKKISAYLNNQAELMKEEFHISLSRPIYFRKYQLDSFTSDIRNAVKDIESFNISFAQLACLTNEEKTRSFLTLEIGNGYNELLHCMKSIDTILTQYRKPVFYNPPRFHTSIAWSLSEKVIQSLKIPSSVIEEDLKEAYHLTKIYIKMGHKIETIPLK